MRTSPLKPSNSSIGPPLPMRALEKPLLLYTNIPLRRLPWSEMLGKTEIGKSVYTPPLNVLYLTSADRFRWNVTSITPFNDLKYESFLGLLENETFTGPLMVWA